MANNISFGTELIKTDETILSTINDNDIVTGNYEFYRQYVSEDNSSLTPRIDDHNGIIVVQVASRSRTALAGTFYLQHRKGYEDDLETSVLVGTNVSNLYIKKRVSGARCYFAISLQTSVVYWYNITTLYISV